MTEDLVTRALIFATAAHAAVGQKRRYTGEDYITRPIAVAEMVKGVPHTETMVAVALLHDVAEDTAVTRDLISEVFGERVTDLVWWLTDDASADGNRAARKAVDRARFARAPAEAQTIKVADLIHNTKSIVARDPDFARVYMREKAALLLALTKADEALVERAWGQIRTYEASLAGEGA